MIFFQLQLGEEQGVTGTSLGKQVKSNYGRAPTTNKVDTPSVRGIKKALKTQDPDRKEELIEGRRNLSLLCLYQRHSLAQPVGTYLNSTLQKPCVILFSAIRANPNSMTLESFPKEPFSRKEKQCHYGFRALKPEFLIAHPINKILLSTYMYLLIHKVCM